MNRLLDETTTGPRYLQQPAIADMIVEVIHHIAQNIHRCTLHAFVVMPNHVHLLVTPDVPLPQITRTLKTCSAKRANEILSLTGTPFWQNETYDHLVRDSPSATRIHQYIEQNPVRAGLVTEPSHYHWSSAGWPK